MRGIPDNFILKPYEVIDGEGMFTRLMSDDARYSAVSMGAHPSIIPLGSPFSYVVWAVRVVDEDHYYAWDDSSGQYTGWVITAGCRWFTIDEAKQHWARVVDEADAPNSRLARAAGMLALVDILENHVLPYKWR